MILCIHLLLIGLTVGTLACWARITWLLRKHVQDARVSRAFTLALVVATLTLTASFAPGPWAKPLHGLALLALAYQIWLVKPWRIGR